MSNSKERPSDANVTNPNALSLRAANWIKTNISDTLYDNINGKRLPISDSGNGTFLEYLDDTPKYYCSIGIRQYNRSNLFDVGTTTRLGQIILPLPLNVVDVHQVDYQERATGLVGAAYTGVNQSRGSPDASQFALATALGTAKTVSGGLNAIGLSNASGAAAAEALLGVSLNEFVVILLKGPKYKRHSLKWKLSPDTFTESTKLRKIIHVINRSMAVDVAGGSGGLLWNFPYIFDIAYYPNPGYLMKFKPMVCEAFVTNFSPNGSPGFYREGQSSDGGSRLSGNNNAPECVDIEMRMIELEYWLTNNFKDNNDPWSGHNVAPARG